MEPQCTCQETRHHPQRDHEDCHRLPETHPNGVPPGIIWHRTSCPTQGKLYTHRLVSKALQDPNHLLHKLVSDSRDLGRQRLPSRRPFSRHSASPDGSNFNTLQAWRTSWQQTPQPPPPQLSVTPNTSLPPGADLPRKDWATLNRLRTGVGQFNANMHRWGLRPSAACPCGAEEQTAHHIIHECPTFPPPNDLDLVNPNPNKVSWLQRLSDTA